MCSGVAGCGGTLVVKDADNGEDTDTVDADHDGYSADDCDDADPTIHPGATEVCNYKDDDCDDHIDDAASAFIGATEQFPDQDADGFGDDLHPRWFCMLPARGWSDVGGDCDDTVAQTYPGAAAIESATLCMTDADLDGWGASRPHAGVAAGTDCDDSVEATHPTAPEVVADGIDQDCVGGDYVGIGDTDGDGVKDDMDRCEGGDDADDVDNDGLPDACECTPDGVITVALAPGHRNTTPDTFRRLHDNPPGVCPIDFITAPANFSVAALNALNVDVLHVPNPSGTNASYTTAQLNWVHDWAVAGGGLTGDYLFGFDVYDHRVLLTDFGVDPALVTMGKFSGYRTLSFVLPKHPVLASMTPGFEDSDWDADQKMTVPLSQALLQGAREIAASSDDHAGIVVNTTGGRRTVYWTAYVEYNPSSAPMDMMYDAFLWAASRAP